MKYVWKTMVVSIVVNIILVFIKFIMGIISGYKSLVADAIHSFSDFATDVVAIFGSWLSEKESDEDHPYGHGKLEYVTSLVIGVSILLLGTSMMYGAFKSNLVENKYRLIALMAVAVTIILKYMLSKYVYKKGKEANNSILIASSKENMSDVLSAISVFAAITLSIFENDVPIFKYADKVCGIIISIFIIKTALHILKENINAIIGECEQDEEVIYKIKGIIMSSSEVLAIDNLTVMKFGAYYQIILEAGVDAKCNLEEAHKIAHKIEKNLIKSDLKIRYVAVHINPIKKRR